MRHGNSLGSGQENSTAGKRQKTNPHTGRDDLGRDTRELGQEQGI